MVVRAECSGFSSAATTFWALVVAAKDAKSTMAIAAIAIHRTASAIGNQFFSNRMAISSYVPSPRPYATGVTAFQPRFQAEAPMLSRSRAMAGANMRPAHTSYPSALGWNPSGENSSFFFQAEDGIRDYKVTGVQTCALPI